MNPELVHGTTTYQGIPCLSSQFGLTPGTTPDTGFVRILVKQPEKLKLHARSPLFTADYREAGVNAAWGFAAEPDKAAIDGASLIIEACGTLVIESQNGRLVYENVWVADEGVSEERAFLASDGVTRVGIVRISLCDERMWWGRRGYVFGSFNKTGVDGRHIQATGKSPDGAPFEMADLLEIALASMPTQNPLGAIVATSDLSEFKPKDKEPRFQNPLDFMQDLIEELRLMPCKQVSGEVDFYSAGEGRDPTAPIAPREHILEDLVTRGHDYTPDAMLLYAQYPTTEEVIIEFTGLEGMVLPDPRTGEWKPAYDMLKYYGMTPKDFEALPCKPSKKRVAFALRFVKPYVKGLPSADDKIPGLPGRQAKNFQAQEAQRRANLIAEHAFKAFRIPEKKMNLLPFENALLTTDKGAEANEDTPFGVPRQISVRISSFGFRRAKEAGQENNVAALALSRWINMAEPVTLYDGSGLFSVQYNTGLLLFKEPMGKIYRRNPDGTVTQIPDDLETKQATYMTAGQPRDVFSLNAPPVIFLHVAHTLRGTRDLRAGPGRRASFPAKVAAIQLQERASPEDHFLVGFDKEGRKITPDQADDVYPEVRQMVGARKMTAIIPDEGTVLRDEELQVQAEKIAKPALARPDGETSRRIKAYGIYTPKVDGVVTQLSWAMGENGVVTTDILIGSLRRRVAPGSVTPFASVGVMAKTSAASSETNAGAR